MTSLSTAVHSAIAGSRRAGPWRLPTGTALAGLTAVLVLAFAFQGTRGIWEPDEGFYANVAVAMMKSGDWLVPRLNGEPFLDKPPLLYWATAAAMRWGGVDEWAARLPQGLWYFGSVVLVAGLAGRWWGRRAGVVAGGVYATTLLPFFAANILTPDTPLAFAVALAYFLLAGLHAASSWLARLVRGTFLGLAIGLGLLAKGPAMLVFVAPFAVIAVLRRRSLAGLFDLGLLTAGLVALVVAAPWYAAIARALPGAGGYLLDSQVLGRLVNADFSRNAGPFDGFAVYLPVLLVGGLPWSVVWLRQLAAALRRGWRGRRLAEWRPAWPSAGPETLLLVGIALPLAVLLAARSRLPLYVLPLFVPLSLLTARLLEERLAGTSPAGGRRWVGWGLAGWVLLLRALKAAAGWVPYGLDARRLAEELTSAGVRPDRLLVIVNSRRNGLAFYGFQNLEAVSTLEVPYPFFAETERLKVEAEEIRSGEAAPLLLVPKRTTPRVEAAMRRVGVPMQERELGFDLSLLSPEPGGAPPGPPPS